jgi:ATP-binding cassette subfamily B protein
MAFRLNLRERLQKPDPDSAYGLIRRLAAETGRKYLGRYLVALLFLGIVSATSAATAWIMKDVTDTVFIEKHKGSLFTFAFIMLAISVIRGFAGYGASMTLSRIGNAIVADTQRRMFNHILDLGIDFYARTNSSELITRLSTNAQAARQVLDTIVNGFGRDLLTVVGLVAVMLVQSPILSIIILVIGPLAVIGISQLVRRIRKIARTEYMALGRIVSSVQEAAFGIRIVKAFNLEPIMRARMDEAIETVRKRANRVARINARSGPLMETLGGLALSALTVFGGYSVVYMDQQPGTFMSLLTAMLLVYEPAKRLGRTRVSLEAGIVGVRLMYQVLDTPPTMNTNPDGPELVVTKGRVSFDRVTFAYRDESPLFAGLDFVAEPGQMTALVGPSGGGKSTMIALIERFYDVSGGTIAIDGQDISKVRIGSLRDRISLVSQDIILFRDTIRENIRFGRPDASDEEIVAAATDALAHEFIAALPEGYDTVIGEQGTQFSGGQRQRLAIARAILRDAPIILLDEATSALDTDSEHKVQTAFDRLMKGRTTIVIAHRLSTILGADKICVLVNGRIVETGRHAELLAAGGRYATLYQLQFAKRERLSA